MATKEDYAILSAYVYNNARGEENQLLLPNGWTELPETAGGDIGYLAAGGLTARAFQKGTEIVIALKGTDFTIGLKTRGSSLSLSYF